MGTETETFLTDIKFTDDLELRDGTGDLDTISGLDNIKQAIFRRIFTEKGSIAHRPDYGVGLKQYQNAPNTLYSQRSLAQKITEELAKDPRIESVLGVRVEINQDEPSKITLILRIKLVGYSEQELVFVPFGGEI